jgi:hypothetical protein
MKKSNPLKLLTYQLCKTKRKIKYLKLFSCWTFKLGTRICVWKQTLICKSALNCCPVLRQSKSTIYCHFRVESNNLYHEKLKFQSDAWLQRRSPPTCHTSSRPTQYINVDYLLCRFVYQNMKLNLSSHLKRKILKA